MYLVIKYFLIFIDIALEDVLLILLVLLRGFESPLCTVANYILMFQSPSGNSTTAANQTYVGGLAESDIRATRCRQGQ